MIWECSNALSYMAQATSGKIACSDWLRRVTCRSVIFRIRPVRIAVFVSHFVYEATTKGNIEKPHKFNEFSKLSTKSCMSRTMNNLKESFTIMKAITTRKTILKMTILCHAIRICKVCCLKRPYNKPLINIARLVITGKYQTLVFYVRTSPYTLGAYCQDLCLIFSRNDRTLG